jgi:bifunctional ADP-heptose synthase (sugar kinase/adenylyltransferase)
MAFASARGNVLLAHLAAPVTLADFAFRDDPFPWHARDPETRVPPIEVRRRRLGPPGAADLAAAKALLARRFAVVGLTERFDESMRAFAEVLAGAPLPASVLAADKASSHTRHADDDRFVSRADLSKDDEKKLASLLAFDLKLYAFAKERFEARYGNGTTS